MPKKARGLPPPPPGFEGINVVQERPVEGAIPEPGGLPPAPVAHRYEDNGTGAGK